ncbi:putative ATP-dependent RNA helicase DHX33 isoform [Arachis hypogaea]|nr:putative ATP-dependent RNA helicase DHX33 isoform [Arachis hypogaea]
MSSMAKRSHDPCSTGKFTKQNLQTEFSAWRQKIAQQRKSFPIASVEKRLIEEVQKNDILIIIGETGCGKTTQIPQFLFGAGFFRDEKVIGITQSRRVAAITVAKWVAEECGVELGQKVSYFVRFDDTTSSSTRIKYMTDGLLLREALLDPYLFEYSIIIFDEVHERTVHTDVLLALLKNVQSAQSRSVADDQSFNFGKKNVNAGISLEKEYGDQSSNFLKKDNHEKYPPLKLIIMSSSIDARTFSEYFGSAKSVHIQGRQFPVDIFYTCHPKEDYFAFIFHLLYLSTDSVILATNIAETSVTIPGVKYVIDPGFVKARSYNSGKDMESLIIVPTSKSQALQKSGRAGCEGPGKCFCLYLKSEFEKLEDSTKPEIKRCNLSNVILQLKALGVDD